MKNRHLKSNHHDYWNSPGDHYISNLVSAIADAIFDNAIVPEKNRYVREVHAITDMSQWDEATPREKLINWSTSLLNTGNDNPADGKRPGKTIELVVNHKFS